MSTVMARLEQSRYDNVQNAARSTQENGCMVLRQQVESLI